MTVLLCATCLIKYLGKHKFKISYVVFRVSQKGEFHCSLCGLSFATPREDVFVTTEMR